MSLSRSGAPILRRTLPVWNFADRVVIPSARAPCSVCDEVGYLTYGSDAANVLFHVVHERHLKKRAMIFTTNKDLKQWGRVLHNDDLAEAIVDRILERGRHFKLDGPSIRTKHLNLDEPALSGADDQAARISGAEEAEFPEPTKSRWSGIVKSSKRLQVARRPVRWRLMSRRSDTRRSPLVAALGEVLREAGFSKKGDTWYRDNDEVLELFNLQKSQYGNQYYLNYALWLKALGPAAFPKEHQAHVSMRVEPTVENSSLVAPLFDLEANVADREMMVKSYLLEKLLPLAASCRSLASVRALYRAGRFSSAMVKLKAQALLFSDGC